MVPILPLELECEIFEIVASLGTKRIPPLLRVARRVKLWLEPWLYRVAFIRDDKNFINAYPGCELFAASGDAITPPYALTAAIARFPASFFHTNIRYLFLDCRAYIYSDEYHETRKRTVNGNTPQDRATLLAVCSGTTDLHLVNIKKAPDLLAGIGNMPLRRLTANLSSLFSSTSSPNPAAIDFSVPMFSGITHLAMSDALPNMSAAADWVPGLAALPHLTHLSFEHNQLHPLFLQVADACAELRVLVVLVAGELRVKPQVSELREVERNPRVVIMSDHKTFEGAHDWHCGARGLGDYWNRAEVLLEERRVAGLQLAAPP